jgi:hypothetical protein
VKLPPRNNNREFSEHQEVEVLSKSSEHDTCGWWKAVIKVSIFDSSTPGTVSIQNPIEIAITAGKE